MTDRDTTNNTQTDSYQWSRYPIRGQESYEVSTQGDRRFSAFVARLQDGRTIEVAYQLDVKGYRTSPTDRDWRKGKKKRPLRPLSQEQLYAEYKALWQQWAIENPPLMAELAQLAKGKVLTDRYASTPVSQARALAELLNEGCGQTTQEQAVQSPTPVQPPALSSPPLIEVINQRYGRPADGIPGDRNSVLGNPFDMSQNEALRNPVCDAYDSYYEAVVYGGAEPVSVANRIAAERGLSLARTWKRPAREAFVAEIDRLEDLARSGEPLKIMCWCATARCHLDTVRRGLVLRLERGQETGIEAQLEVEPQSKPYNPLRNLPPLNPRVAVPMQKDIAMAEIATQFIGQSAAPSYTPSSTRNYMNAWAAIGRANTGSYTAQDVVMVSGSGPWRGVTQSQIEITFKAHYEPLLERVAQTRAQVVVGAAAGTDQLIRQYLEARGYQFESTNGYLRGCPQVVVEVEIQVEPSPTEPLQPLQTPLTLPHPAPDRITSLAPNQVFVFGSNAVGHHGGGAAGYAFRGDATPHYQNIQGQVGKWCVGGVARGYQEGTEGRSYAIVTKDAQLTDGRVTIGGKRSIPLPAVAAQIDALLTFAHSQPQLEFLVSEFGTQLAGYSTREIGQLWVGKAVPPNVHLPQAFIDVLNDRGRATLTQPEPMNTHASPASPTSPPESGPAQLRTDIEVHSGGQTGADLGALIAARQLGIPTGGMAPQGWLVERCDRFPDGTNPQLAEMGLVEAPAGRTYEHTLMVRTRMNVQQTDGTVVFGSIDPDYDKGSYNTLLMAEESGKTWIHFEREELNNPQKAGRELRAWLIAENIRVVNIAGNRGSKWPELEDKVTQVVAEALREPLRELPLPQRCGFLIDEYIPPEQAEGAYNNLERLVQRVCLRATEVREPVQFLLTDHPYAHWVEAAVQKVRLEQWEGRLGYTPILTCRTSDLPTPEPTQRKYLLCLSDRAKGDSSIIQTAAAIGVHVVGYDYRQGTFFQQTQDSAPTVAATGSRKRADNGR